MPEMQLGVLLSSRLHCTCALLCAVRASSKAPLILSHSLCSAVAVLQVVCDPGYYCPDPGTKVPCPAGTVSANAGAISSDVCLP